MSDRQPKAAAVSSVTEIMRRFRIDDTPRNRAAVKEFREEVTNAMQALHSPRLKAKK
jgi:hypothetical protein